MRREEQRFRKGRKNRKAERGQGERNGESRKKKTGIGHMERT